MTEYLIELPSVEDARGLAEVHTQAWLETYPNQALGISQEYIERWVAPRLSEEGLARRRAAIELARMPEATYFLRIARDDNGRAVGFIDGTAKEGVYWLDGLYTLKDTYGTGLGQLLWRSYLNWVGDRDVHLTVATYNARAIAFYEKLGFVVQKGTERKFGDTPIPVLDMVRMRTTR